MQSRTVKQANLSSECWLVQFFGPDKCKSCDLRDTDECGGEDIRKTGKNAQGHKVPVS